MDIVKLGPDGQLALPIEMYTSERIAEFERESEVDADTRAAARKAVDTANGWCPCCDCSSTHETIRTPTVRTS
jgi:hypothetical protein